MPQTKTQKRKHRKITFRGFRDFRVFDLAVSSLPVEPYDAVYSLKKPHETGQVYQANGSQGLILFHYKY